MISDQPHKSFTYYMYISLDEQTMHKSKMNFPYYILCRSHQP